MDSNKFELPTESGFLSKLPLIHFMENEDNTKPADSQKSFKKEKKKSTNKKNRK